jgi:hypothetical protein
MFIRHDRRIERPFEELIDRFVSPAREWVPDLAVDPENGTQVVRSTLGTPNVTKQVEMRVREAFVHDGGAVIPIRLVATGPKGLFPQLDADLELVPDGPDASRLTLLGSYRLPLGPLGEVIDRSLLHSFREASIENFMDRVAAVLAAKSVAA